MDKEIIIDGVDVGGCKYFQIEANTIYPKAHYCGSTFNRFCEDDDNCVFKQLKRLEQENRELVHYLACMTEQRNKANTTLQKIKAIAEEWMKDYCYLDNFKDKEGCCICHENKDCYSYRLLKALTKVEEE